MFLAAKLGRLLLAAVLLAGWQSALLHPIEHVDERGAFVHAAGGHDGHEHEGGGEATALCDAIAAVAAVLGGHAAAPLPASAGPFAAPAYRGGGTHGAPRLAYRSHAPPLHS
jgi:hypothetical protein